MIGRWTVAGLVVVLALVGGCDRKGQGPNGSCGQTPGQCGYHQ